ncbi:MAG TPA: 50S ribosomal protein L9 [Oscillospiraceae bacterium]|nr:50S ribosomal protein L9 [Oscillospiraceae bacterium]
MKVILQQDVKGQGKKGALVDVSDGYARNYLLPRKLAVAATADNLNAMKLQEKARAAQLAAEKKAAEEAAEKLQNSPVRVSAKAGAGGRLFGAVTSKEIAEALSAQHGIEVQKTAIVQDEAIKAFGSYELKCKLGHGVTGTIYLLVTEEK